MTVRPAGLEAAPALAGLHAVCFADGENWDAGSIGSLLGTPGTVAVMEDEAGFGMFRVAGEEADVLTLAVVPAARRRGLGGALLTAGIEWCGALGARAMFLEVAASNVAARALYGRAGFVAVGWRRGYYGKGEDAVVMRAGL